MRCLETLGSLASFRIQVRHLPGIERNKDLTDLSKKSESTCLIPSWANSRRRKSWHYFGAKKMIFLHGEDREWEHQTLQLSSSGACYCCSDVSPSLPIIDKSETWHNLWYFCAVFQKIFEYFNAKNRKLQFQQPVSLWLCLLKLNVIGSCSVNSDK